MDQDAGEGGLPHDDPEGPPRRRANDRRGHGTSATDRPPVAGVVGRESGEVRREALETAGGSESDAAVDGTCPEGTVVTTDEWTGVRALLRPFRGVSTW